MGLLDILNSIQNAPSGQSQPAGGSQPASGGGMSPMMLALLGLLAYKALQSGALGNILGGGQPAPAGGAGRAPAPAPGGTAGADSPGDGGLADILGGLLGGGQAAPARGAGRGTAGVDNPGGGGLADILGGLLGGGAGGARPGGDGLGGLLSGGLGKLVKDLQSSGQGDVAKSWVGTGPNKAIEPQRLEAAVGTDTLDALARQTGMRREDLLAGLSQYLPDFVDQLTPNGRVPTGKEAAQLV